MSDPAEPTQPAALPAPAVSSRRMPFALALLALALSAWGAGLVVFATRIPDRVADATTRTDAIVVLTGGAQRIQAGIELLSFDKAEKLFVSGVYRGVDARKLLRLSGREGAGLEPRIVLGTAANTAENARETAAWLRQQRFASLRLVTGAYHMPRSLLELRHAIPEATLVPHPVFPERVKAEWWAWPGTLLLIAGEYHKFLLAWARLNVGPLFAAKTA